MQGMFGAILCTTILAMCVIYACWLGWWLGGRKHHSEAREEHRIER